MSISEPDQHCARLRQKLKEWEASFAADHGGRKPSREDVKQNPDIAQRYKDYNKLRLKISNPEISSSQSYQRKRPPSTSDAPITLFQTPTKRLKPLPNSHPSVIDPYDPPISLLSASQQRPYIGPTPQKDGRVLGMFDGLSNHSRSRTPSKRQALEIRTPNMQATPSKKLIPQENPMVKDATKVDVKITPSIQRITNICTPGSRNTVRKLQFDDTPAFLRRDSQQDFVARDSGAVTQQGTSWSPVTVRKLPQLAGRSLSTIVRGLRDLEDEHLDEELGLMRELEGEVDLAVLSKPMSKSKILVEDGQIPDMPLGPDRGQNSENEEADYIDEGKDKSGKPLKIWKKKGQKRTTRLTKMRPNTAKWKPEQKWRGGDSDGESQTHKETEDIVNDLKSDDGEAPCVNGTLDNSTDSEDVAKDNQTRKTKSGKSTRPAKARKKISATAHANYRALKIKNKNSRTKRGRRFGKTR